MAKMYFTLHDIFSDWANTAAYFPHITNLEYIRIAFYSFTCS